MCNKQKNKQFQYVVIVSQHSEIDFSHECISLHFQYNDAQGHSDISVRLFTKNLRDVVKYFLAKHLL